VTLAMACAHVALAQTADEVIEKSITAIDALFSKPSTP
jgi:hypothetical protein